MRSDLPEIYTLHQPKSDNLQLFVHKYNVGDQNQLKIINHYSDISVTIVSVLLL